MLRACLRELCSPKNALFFSFRKDEAGTNGLKVRLLLLKRVFCVAHEDACLAHAGVANEQNPNHTVKLRQKKKGGERNEGDVRNT